MRWLVRTDSSALIGAGHVMRCLTLANQLKAHGAQTEFACRELPGHIASAIVAQGFDVHMLSGETSLPADWTRDANETLAALHGERADGVVVDHYDLDVRWETAIRPRAACVLVIDDLANRPHDCDVLLDTGWHDDLARRYEGLLPAHCRQLLGPGHTLLRQEFRIERGCLRREFECVRRVLVNFGGMDELNITGTALSALADPRFGALEVDVVIGATCPHRAAIEHQVALEPRFHLYVQAANMAHLMARADLAIGACGGSTWERCFLGLPTLAVVVADNQREGAAQLARAGVIVSLGEARTLTVELLVQATARMIADQPARVELSRRSLSLMPVDVPNLARLLIATENAHA